jgi:hypothetical protein
MTSVQNSLGGGDASLSRSSYSFCLAPAHLRPNMPRDRVSTVGRLAAIIGHGQQGRDLARMLARRGIRSRADLKKPEVLARLPREARASVLFNPARSVPLAIAQAVMAEVLRRLVLGGPRLRFEVIPVGSVRRQAPRVHDMDLLVVIEASGIPRRALASATLRPARRGDRLEIADTYLAGQRRRSFILRASRPGGRPAHYRTDLFLATRAEKPYALFHYTGSSRYNIRTRALAKRKGWLLNQNGLFDAAHPTQRVPGTSSIRTERDLARFLGVSYRLPTDRER